MANKTVYPYGTNGTLPSSVGIINDLTTGGSDKALSAEQGKVLDSRIMDVYCEPQLYSLVWHQGNLENNGTIGTYKNQYTDPIVLQDKYPQLIISNPTVYTVKIGTYASNDSFLGYASVGLSPGDTDVTYYPEVGVAYVRLCAWDKPSASDVEPITVRYYPSDTLFALRQAVTALQTPPMFTNPLADLITMDMADPCVVDGEDGFYYMLCTGSFTTRIMYRSTDLVHWENGDVPFTPQAITECLTDLNVSSFDYWAPEIVKVGTKYNLYCSKGANPMLVFQSEHPYFGYEYKGKIMTAHNATSDNIDACVRYDFDGSLYIFWGSARGICRQKLSDDGLTLDTTDTRVRVAGLENASGVTRNQIFEGAYLYRRNGYWYLFASAGTWSNRTYRVVVGRSATLTGTFVDKEGNDMADGYGTVILSSSNNSETLNGPGHNGIIIKDRQNRYYMIYHAHYTGAESTSSRYICLQQMFWDNDGWPYFENDKPKVSNNIVPVL